MFVKKAKHKIASILKLKSSTLHLHKIDEGSIILVLSIPEFVANEIFPLESATKAKLKREGFQVMVPFSIRDYISVHQCCVDYKEGVINCNYNYHHFITSNYDYNYQLHTKLTITIIQGTD